MFTESEWIAWGASDACAFAIPVEENTGATTRNYADAETPAFPVPAVEEWYSSGDNVWAALTLDTPVQTIKETPLREMFGNASDLSARGQGVLMVSCTGPVGHDSRPIYLNIEVGDVSITQRMCMHHIRNDDELYFPKFGNPGILDDAIRPGIITVSGRRYFIATHYTYAPAQGLGATVGHLCRYYVKEFDGASNTGNWEGEGRIISPGGIVDVNGGHQPVLGWYNTNIAPNAGAGATAQLIQGYALFYTGFRGSVDDMEEAVEYLGSRWPVGDMATWTPWIDMDPTLGDWPSRNARIRRGR